MLLSLSSMPCRALSSVSGLDDLACPIVEANMSMLPVPMQVSLDPAYYNYQVSVNSKGLCIFCRTCNLLHPSPPPDNLNMQGFDLFTPSRI